MMNSPDWLKRWLRCFLGLDIFIHTIEVGIAIYEGAYITAGVIGFTGIVMLLALWILGEEHKHIHTHPHNHEG